MKQVFDRLVVELEKPRELTAQSLRHFSATYGVDRQEVGAFLDTRLAGLAEDELDLSLSALYTPKLADQALFAGLLGKDSIPTEELPTWVDRLHRRPTTGHLVSADGVVHPFELQPVTVERYVLRLRIDGTTSDAVLRLIQTLAPPEEQPLLLAVARRAIWNTPDRCALLEQFLARSYAGDPPVPGDLEAFLALVESSEPTGVADVIARLPAWEQVVRTQVSSANQPSPFFNERVQDLHGGGRDQRGTNEPLRTQKQAELEFLGRLKRMFGTAG